MEGGIANAGTREAETIFNVAFPLGPAERAAYVARACGADLALREKVEALLEAHDHVGNFLPEKPKALPPGASIDFPEREQAGDWIGRYQLIEKLGEGGCGVVYRAEQIEPVRRPVALKVIKLGMDTKQVMARFEAERQALAMMDHANIAKVLDVGSTETGRPYFVMELVRGVRITEYCDQNNLHTKERLDLFIKVCHAIQHAHQKGVIHRDIKPSNILVTLHDGVPVPKVIDFGIAKATEGRLTDGTVYTQLLHFIGTPAYMSPEQAEMSGLDIDTRSDIYSLGVLLYELLTGKTPFDGQQMMASGIDAMRKTIREEEPVPPSLKLSETLVAAEVTRRTSEQAESSAPSRRRLQNTITLLRGDLDWIVMKCLEKDRTRRYDTANGLAADLNRYLNDEPVIARPPTPLYRFRKMVRRNKLAFASASAVMVALIVGLLLASWQAIRAINAERGTRRSTYALEINVAFHSLADNNLGQALGLLNRQRPTNGVEDLRDFEWRYLWQACQGDEFDTFRDEGAAAAAFSPDGKLLAYSGDNIIVREAASHKRVVTLPSPAAALSFAPHTNLLASGHASGVKLWNTETWQLVRSLSDTMEPSLFSPDGRWLLTGVAGAFRVWDTQTWQPKGDCPGAPLHRYNARNAVAFSPDNQFLVTVAGQNAIGSSLRVWRLPSLEEELPEIRFGLRARPGSVAFSVDGKHLLTGLWDGQLVIQEFATRKRVEALKENRSWITAVVVTPDRKIMATASSDRTVNLWDATTFEHLVRLRGHVLGLKTLAVSPDGSTIVTGGGDGTTKLWHTATRHTEPALEGFGVVAGFTGDGRQLVAANGSSWCVWTPGTGARVDFPTPNSPTVITSGKPSGKPYDVKPDEPLGALGRADGAVEIWHLTTGERLSAWSAHNEGIGAVDFSPDGKLLATGTIKGEVKIWDFATKLEVGRFGPVDCQFFCLAFSPDGQTLAASGRSSSVWLWDLSTRGKHRQLSGHALIVASVVFSPDGTLLATPSLGNEVRLWELPSGRQRMPLYGHVGGVTAAAFSPQGKTLATAGMDMKVKLWNIATQQELATIPVVVEFPTLSFSPDGRVLAVGEMARDNRRIQILHAPSFEEIAAAEAKP